MESTIAAFAGNRRKGGFLSGAWSCDRPARRACAYPAPPTELTVIVPAYNEAASVTDTIRSLQAQSTPPEEIIVVDDCSNDGTGDAARRCGVTVVRPPKNTGTKAGAQNFGLGFVRTRYTMAIDADTTLALDAIEKLLPALKEPGVAAASGFVIPRHVRSTWERGRYIEYLFAFSFYKPVQDYYGKPLISSGCFSVYRTDVLREGGGWSTRTMAEDMDLTWTYYRAGHGVRFVPQAVCYPIEPSDFDFMRKQLRRWSAGFVQNVLLHWRGVAGTPYLRLFIAAAMWDSVFASVTYLFLLPLLAIVLARPAFLLGYVIDLAAVVIPVLVAAAPRRELGRAVASLPAFFVLRLVNAYFMLHALWMELVMRRPLRVYEKGH
jgi:biofilm PGA synthesis N-glycosyltransferase PgaC